MKNKELDCPEIPKHVTKHLDYLVSQYLAFYHAHRPHQGLENRLILPAQPPSDDNVPELTQIFCHQRLGGLLKNFERRAA